MLWETLKHRMDILPGKSLRDRHVYALLQNPNTHLMEKVYLDLKFDVKGQPYLVKSHDQHKPKTRKLHGTDKL